MSKLFEKLQKLQKLQGEQKQEGPQESETTEDAAQCACGSHLEGECPECDAPADPSREQEGDLLSRLRGIGDQQQVNPPDPTPKTEPKPQKKKGKERCPNCGREFKDLSRHKCKVTPQSPPEPKPEPQEPPETVPRSIQADVKKFEPPKEEEETTGRGSFVLLLDAVLERSNYPADSVHHFSDIIAPICDAVAKENQAGHWKSIDYGKGSGYLSLRMERWLEQNDIVGVLLADNSTPELKACKEVLKRRALSIIQGVR
jgi:hypothetical protein